MAGPAQAPVAPLPTDDVDPSTAPPPIDLDAELEAARAAAFGPAGAPQQPDEQDEDGLDSLELEDVPGGDLTTGSAEPAASDQEGQAPDAEPEDSQPRLSRRQKFEQRVQEVADQRIQAALAQADQARADREAAQRELDRRNDEDLRRFEAVRAAYGTPEGLDELERKALDHDYDAIEELKSLKERRALIDGASFVGRTETLAALQQGLDAVRNTAGFPREKVDAVLAGQLGPGELFTAIRDAAYAHGKAEAERAAEARLEKQRAEYESKLARAIGRVPSPDSGGQPTAGQAPRLNWIGPDGLPTDEAQRLWEMGGRPFEQRA